MFSSTTSKLSTTAEGLGTIMTNQTGGVLVSSGIEVGPSCQFNSDPVS